jgi:RNase P subunit RPR2
MWEDGTSATENPPIGTCPACSALIPGTDPVITYETADGWPRMIAECSACGECVSPV